MIKVSLAGAGSLDGGELIRLLAMHPDVEIVSAAANGLEGQPISSVHHGLIGETKLNFSQVADLKKADVLFLCDRSFNAADFHRLRHSRPDLKVIMLEKINGVDEEAAGIVYGLPEINRKLLVRGATAARVPYSFASMALVALFPFARHLLLNGDVQIDVCAPQAILDVVSLPELEKEIVDLLSQVQASFKGKVAISATASRSRRSALMKIRFAGSLGLQQMLDLFDVYDDHRFAFVTTSQVGVSEVAGTDKCVVTVSRGNNPGEVVLGAAADCRLRGGAGEALHIMNLMCGLHEKTGLALKAIDFEPIE